VDCFKGDASGNRTGMQDNVVFFPVGVNIGEFKIFKLLLRNLPVHSIFKFAVLSVVVSDFLSSGDQLLSDVFSKFIGGNHTIDAFSFAGFNEAVGDVSGINLFIGVENHFVVLAGFI